MSSTPSIEQVQLKIAELLAEFKASDFKGLTDGNEADSYYQLAEGSLTAAHIYLTMAEREENNE